MSTPTPSIPGVDREALARVLREAANAPKGEYYKDLADAALAHIAAHHECACDREHDDDETEARPDTCCGKCPPIVGGGFDCTCEGNPRCVKAAYPALHFPVEIEPSETICGHCSWQLPNGRFFGQLVEWPCPTAALLNPTEGETTDE